MKKNLLTCLFTTVIFCQNAAAQSRIKKNYLSDDGAQTIQSQRNITQTFLPASLNGYYFEGFESTFPPAGWQIVDVIDSVNGWSSSTTADYPDAYEGLQAAYCRYAFPGPIGEDWFITPKFTVTVSDSLMFQFKWESLGYQYDSTFILISTTDSALSSFTNTVALYVDTTTIQILGVVGGWYYKTYSLNAFAGQDIYVAFVNKNSNGDAIYIDNVELGTRPAAEVSVKSIDMDNYYPSGISNPLATIKNRGGVTQTFNVTMNIGGGYTFTKSVTVTPQATSQISFDPWNAMVGNYTINVQTFLTGDANPANDTLSSTIQVLEPFVNYGWSTHDPLVTPTTGGAAVSVCTNSNSRYFLMGGYTSIYTNEVYEYDLSFATWAGINPMSSATEFPASAKANGKLFVFGGDNGTANNDTTQIYDYNTGSWTTGASMPIPVANCAFGTYKDSLVYIIGGNIGGAVGSTAVQIYNTYNDTWATGTTKPGANVYSNRAGIVGNKIVTCGGFDSDLGSRIGTTYIGVIDPIDPTQIAWTQVSDHPTGIISRAGAATSLDPSSGLVIFCGGANSTVTSESATTFAFDVNSNTWKIGPLKPTSTSLFYMTPVLQNDSLYIAALGGEINGTPTDKNEWLNLGFYQIPTGIAENNFVADAILFPNPASAVTTLSLNLKYPSHITITINDVIGHAVMTVCEKNFVAGKKAIPIQTKNLGKGMYFCLINVDGYLITKKLIKN